jgi:anti-sigma regulatory factor (Ser/Thr protein kinase)
MPVTSTCLQLAIDSAPENLRLARQAVAEAAADAGADGLAVGDIALAVNEAMSNAVRHAYMPAAGPICVSAERDGATFAVVVRDGGRGFLPREDPRPSEDGGFGLKLIDELTSEFTILSQPDRGTEVHMVFALPGASAGRP